MEMKRATFLSLLAAAAWAASIARAGPELRRQGEAYVLTGAPLIVRWDAHTGALISISHAASGTTILEGPERPFDLHTDDGWLSSALARPPASALSLDGSWQFRTARGKWRRITVPGAWEDQGVTHTEADDPDPSWKPYNGHAYYKRYFDLPTRLRGKDLVLCIGRVDDFDWVQINGKQVGHTGEEVEEWWAAPRRYPVPASLLKPKGNLIEVHVYDRGGEGGILGPIMLVSPDQVARLKDAPLALSSARLVTRGDLAEVTLRYEAAGWRAEEVYRVALAGPAFVSRSAQLIALEGAGTPKFDMAVMYLGRIAGPLQASASIAAPYTWPPVDQPLSKYAKGGSVALHCGQAVPGVAIYARRPPLAFAIGQYWEKDWNLLSCRGVRDAVRVESRYLCQGRVRAGLRIPFGGQFLMFAEQPSQASALRAIGLGWQRLGFKRVDIPRWAESIALYSLHPGGTMGSWTRDLRSPNNKPPALRNFQRLQLPILKRLGVNAIWFLPIWPRGYGVSDYWSIDPTLGTLDDLREVVADAHSAGIRVLCDLIPHGPHESSGLAKEHPEFISRHEDGSILYWWGCLACDYANPGWQDYMARVATHWTKEADIDGWRVDCAAGGPANWRPYGDNLPSWSGQWGGLRHMERVRTAMSRVKPDHVLLAEAANPPMLSQAHFIYDWPAEQVLFRVLTVPRAEWVRQTRKWLEFQRLALPPGSAFGLMRFTENHDQLHSEWQLGPDVARAVWALIALAQGFPLVYHEQEVGYEDLWARLLQVRRSVPELHRGQAEYLAVECDQPEVMAFLRRDGARASIVLINFSGSARRCGVVWAGAPSSLTHSRVLPTGSTVPVSRKGRALRVSVAVPPWAWRVVVLRSSQAGARRVPLPSGMAPPVASPRPPTWANLAATVTVSAGEEERTVTVTSGGGRSVDSASGSLRHAVVRAAGGWQISWRDGLISGLSVEGKPLVDGAWLAEGAEQVSWGRPLGFGARFMDACAPAQPDRHPPRPVRWRVAPSAGGLVLEYEGERGEFSFSSRWLVRSDGIIHGSVSVTPVRASEPVIGQLYFAMGSSRAERWLTHTLEGDVGGPFFVRHPTPRELTGRFWHPLQRLWEHTVIPLNPALPAFGWQVAGHWLWLEFDEYPSDAIVDDIYLREYAPDGRPGLTAYVAFMEGRHGHSLSPDKPFTLRFRLLLDSEPRPRKLRLPVVLRADGANWYLEGAGYALCIARSSGGQARWLAPMPHRRPVCGKMYTYSDHGIFDQWTDSFGRKLRVTGSTDGDLEPDCWINPSVGELRLRFRGYMRQAGNWRNIASPRVEYETVWHFDRSPRIRVYHRARPLTTPRHGRKAFLAQVIELPRVRRWAVLARGKALSGSPKEDQAGRVIESRRIGRTVDGFTIDTQTGRFRLQGLRAWGEAPQNVFLLRVRDRPDYRIFLAMLDGQPVDLDARWRGFTYELVAEPGR